MGPIRSPVAPRSLELFMPRLAALPLALIALSSCQVVPVGTEESQMRLAQVEAQQSELVREIQGLRGLVAARGKHAPGVDGEIDRALDALQLAATLAGLESRFNELQATQAASASFAPVPASHAREETAAANARIKLLGNALLALEEGHAMHCENLANASVPGYKRRIVRLALQQDLASEIMVPAAMEHAVNHNQGVLELSGNQCDMGIEGAGYFEVEGPDGSPRYTRNGTFQADFQGRLVTPQGARLSDVVLIPQDSNGMTVTKDGQAFSMQEGNQFCAIGNIRLRMFPNAEALRRADSWGFKPTAASGAPVPCQPGVGGAGQIVQGYIERSNVEVTEELLDLQIMERQAAAIRRVLAGLGVYSR